MPPPTNVSLVNRGERKREDRSKERAEERAEERAKREQKRELIISWKVRKERTIR